MISINCSDRAWRAISVFVGDLQFVLRRNSNTSGLYHNAQLSTKRQNSKKQNIWRTYKTWLKKFTLKQSHDSETSLIAMYATSCDEMSRSNACSSSSPTEPSSTIKEASHTTGKKLRSFF